MPSLCDYGEKNEKRQDIYNFQGSFLFFCRGRTEM